MQKASFIIGLCIAIAGQLAYYLWSATWHPSLRAVAIVLLVKLLGDFIGRFVLHLDHYNWVYFRDYFAKAFIQRLAPYAAFLVLWLAVTYWIALKDVNSLVLAVWNGGLLPALFYVALNRENFQKSTTDNHRLKRKL